MWKVKITVICWSVKFIQILQIDDDSSLKSLHIALLYISCLYKINALVLTILSLYLLGIDTKLAVLHSTIFTGHHGYRCPAVQSVISRCCQSQQPQFLFIMMAVCLVYCILRCSPRYMKRANFVLQLQV